VSPVTGKRRVAPAAAGGGGCGRSSGGSDPQDDTDPTCTHYHDTLAAWMVMGHYHFEALSFTGQDKSLQHGAEEEEDCSLDSMLEPTSPTDQTTATVHTKPAPTLEDPMIASTLNMVQRMIQEGWNPVGQLNEYFQKRTKQSIHHCFEDVSIPTSLNGAVAWNCRFGSPDPVINQHLNGGCDAAATLSSCLPLALFRHAMTPHSNTSAHA
jgi:hypothetical protein